MNVGSLFAGIGGFDLGLERAGMRTLWQVERDPYRRAVLARHFPDAERYDDVATVGAHNLAPVHVLAGGFPCQDLSLAGAGAGIEGARSGLWSEFARLIGELGPRYAVVENVPALAARGLGRVLRDLAALGYDAEWDCLPASAFGAPHQRDRLWLVAYPNGDGVRLIAERDQREGWEVRAALGGYALAPHDGSSRAVANAEGKPIGAGLRAGEQREQRRRRLGDGGGENRAVADASRDAEGRAAPPSGAERERAGASRQPAISDPDAAGLNEQRRPEPSRAQHPAPELGGRWLPEPDVGRVADGVPRRVDRLAALGDSLVPQIAEWVGRRLMGSA